MQLNNKTAIVTGAAHGIGRAIGELFAEHGSWGGLADVDDEAGEAVAKGVCERGGHAKFVHSDVTLPGDVERTVKTAAERSGRVDVLVNNAAHLGDWLDVASATPEQWDHSFAITLKGAAHFIRAVLPIMVR